MRKNVVDEIVDLMPKRMIPRLDHTGILNDSRHYAAELVKIRGCPCSQDCCDDPDIVTPDHDCDETADFCEDCCYSQCLNCGAQCGCEV